MTIPEAFILVLALSAAIGCTIGLILDRRARGRR